MKIRMQVAQGVVCRGSAFLISFMFALHAMAQTRVEPPSDLSAWWPDDPNVTDLAISSHDTSHNMVMSVTSNIGKACSSVLAHPSSRTTPITRTRQDTQERINPGPAACATTNVSSLSGPSSLQRQSAVRDSSLEYFRFLNNYPQDESLFWGDEDGLTNGIAGLKPPSIAPMSGNAPSTRGNPRWSVVKLVPLVAPSMACELGSGGMVGVGPP